MNKWCLSIVFVISLTGCSQTIHEPVWENCFHANCSSHNTESKNVLFSPKNLSEN